MKRKLIVFDTLQRLVSEAWKHRPMHSKCETIIRNGLICGYNTPVENIELRWNPSDIRGMKPDEIVTVGPIKSAMKKRVREMRTLIKNRSKDVG